MKIITKDAADNEYRLSVEETKERIWCKVEIRNSLNQWVQCGYVFPICMSLIIDNLNCFVAMQVVPFIHRLAIDNCDVQEEAKIYSTKLNTVEQTA